MTPDLLRRAGEALFGRNWQTQFADEFEVNPRTLRHWLAGQEIPITVSYAIFEQLEGRVFRVQQLLADVRQACGALRH
jgi:hypothetical protein